MAYDSESDLSGDEFNENVGAIDLVNVNARQRIELEAMAQFSWRQRQWHNLVGDSDKDEFDGFEPADLYRDRQFTNWVKV